ncbi:citrate transporter [Candidatus Sumerlaeota bacterium]|nr:citrate transporter [Candidatus Sumerlaeota bacterium]
MSGVLVFIVFIIGSLAMIRRWLPALLTLPLMALAMVAVAALTRGGISFTDVTVGVVKQGSLLLSEAIVTAFFGGMISFVMQKSGAAESLVKNGAELVGDNPFAVAVFSMGLIALLFTTIGGLGALMMVCLVVVPMLATAGIPSAVIGGIILIGLSMGGTMNPIAWASTKNSLGVSMEQIQGFSVIVFLLMAMAGLVFIAVELYRARQLKAPVRTGMILLGLVAACGVAVSLIGMNLHRQDQKERAEKAAQLDAAKATAAAEKPKDQPRPLWIRIPVAVFLGAVVLRMLHDHSQKMKRWRHQVAEIRWYAYLIPIVPLLLIFAFKMEAIPAFLCGFVYAIVSTLRPGSISLTVQSMIQGSAATLPAVMLMIGIGILITAVRGPSGWSDAHGGQVWPVIAGIQPYFEMLPKSKLGYVIVFTICAPLALYRGPLNTWGLGFGMATLLITGAGYPAAAVMGMLATVGQIQGVCDPTNTANVWLANELRVDVMSLMWRTLPYIWIMGVVGLIISALVFM